MLYGVCNICYDLLQAPTKNGIYEIYFGRKFMYKISFKKLGVCLALLFSVLLINLGDLKVFAAATLTVSQTIDNNKVAFKVSDTVNLNDSVSILVMQKGANSIIYMDQGKLSNGEYVFLTVLPKGDYTGYVSSSSTDNVAIQDFTVSNDEKILGFRTIAPINVEIGSEVVLPSTVIAIFDDGANRVIAVNWSSKPDTTRNGKQIILGVVDGYDVKASIVVNVGASSTDAILSGITVAGKALESFANDITEYNIVLPIGTTTVPKVEGIISDTEKAEVTQALALPGTATINVTLGDGGTKSYKVNFTVALPDKTALEKAIADANELNVADYTTASWSALQTAIGIAQNSTYTSQAEVDNGIVRVNNAIKALVVRDSTAPVIQIPDKLTFMQNESIQINITASEEASATDNIEVSGVAKIEVIFNGQNVTGSAIYVDSLSMLVGQYPIVVIAYDKAGNKSEKAFTLNVTMDIDNLDELISIGTNKGLIKNKGVSNSLLAKVRKIQEDKSVQERLKNSINAMQQEVTAQYGKHIDAGFAKIILEDLKLVESQAATVIENANKPLKLDIPMDIDNLDELITLGVNKGYIDNKGVANSLFAKVGKIQQDRNVQERLRNSIIAMQQEVTAQSGNHISVGFSKTILEYLKSIEAQMNK
jgi:hypothetical protein